MAVYLHPISKKAIFVEFKGLITHQQVVEAYQNLACQTFEYLLYDGTDMIYDEEAFYGADLDALVAHWFRRADFKLQFLVLPDDHDLRDPVAHSYEVLGFLPKVRFVTTREDGLTSIRLLESK